MNMRINALAGALALVVLGTGGARAQETAGHGHGGKQDAQVRGQMQELTTPEEREKMRAHMQSVPPVERERMQQKMMALPPEERARAVREQVQQLDRVVVTGSLLPGLELENASPLLTITADDIERNGFGSVAEALKTMPFATGGVRDSTPIGGGNAQSTKIINLFGLGPSFTKVLINGHPVANYPLSYNTGGGGNFTDLSNIPMSIVERIEILPGSQSAIYGSDAISGVVNIILKRRVEGVNLGVRLGGYEHGGGASRRLQLTGGKAWDDTRLVYAFEHRESDPIIATQRELTARRPYEDDAFAYSMVTGEYFDPGAAGCAQMSHLFGNTTTYRQDEDGNPYCGSDYTASFATTFDAEREQSSGFVSVEHAFEDRLTAYADFNYTLAEAVSNCCVVYYWDLVPINGVNWRVSREFAPEEQGSFDTSSVRKRSHQYDIAFGIRGTLGGSNWDYEAGYARSWYQLKEKAFLPLNSAMNGYLRNRYQDLSQVFVPLTPEEYASFSADRTRKAESSTDQLSVKFANTELFEMPGGHAGLALVGEAGREDWDDRPDDRYRAGEFFWGAQQASHGDRERYGLTAQFDMPLHEKLKLSTAGRYDRYSYGGRDVDSSTWRVGLEFRPLDSLLLRAMVGTSFRAADMSFLYAGETRGNSNNYDLYLCDTLGVPRTHASCRYVMSSYSSGNLDLEPTTAKSKSVGFVWSPMAHLSVHADYLDIEIEDEVRTLSAATILADEASCRQGGPATALPSCEYALSRVIRGDDGRITRINGGYFNVAYKRMKTVVAGVGYELPAGNLGNFHFNLSGNYILDFQQQNDAFSPLVDAIASPQGQGSFFRSIYNGSVGWEKGPFIATLFGVRYGKSPNYALLAGGWSSTQWGTPGYDPAWTLFNASLRYTFDPGVDVALVVNNLQDRMPPSRGWTSYPNYNSQLYNVYGRSLSLEFNYRF